MTSEIESWCSKNNIILAGILPFDKRLTESMVMGKTIIEHDPDTFISLEIKRILNYILNEN